MATYIILSKFSPEAFREPHEFKKLAEAVSAKIKSECSGVKWKDSFATLGRFDVVDIVEANDPKQIEKAAIIIRAYGHSTTETLVATPWKDFLKHLPYWIRTQLGGALDCTVGFRQRTILLGTGRSYGICSAIGTVVLFSTCRPRMLRSSHDV